MPETIIRPVEAKDAESIHQLFTHLRVYHAQKAPQSYRTTAIAPGPELLATWAEKGVKTWVAEQNGRVVGYIRVKQKETGQTPTDSHQPRILWHINHVVVEEGARRQGISQRLLARVEAEARQTPGIQGITITVSDFNTAAQQSYKKSGFQPIEIEMRKLF